MTTSEMVEGSADCYYENVHAWHEALPVVGTRAIIDDPDDAYDHWCEYEQLERHRSDASAHASSSAKHRGESSSSYVAKLFSPVRVMQVAERHARAQSAGPPPSRKHYTSATQFRAVRSRWYQHFTGNLLEQSGSPAEQQSAFDAVARSWRAYSDGRRSLSASQWDGRLTPAERQTNNP